MNRLSSALVCAALPILALLYFGMTTGFVGNLFGDFSVSISDVVISGVSLISKFGIAFAMGACVALLGWEAFGRKSKVSYAIHAWSTLFLFGVFSQFHFVFAISSVIAMCLALLAAGIVESLFDCFMDIFGKQSEGDEDIAQDASADQNTESSEKVQNKVGAAGGKAASSVAYIKNGLMFLAAISVFSIWVSFFEEGQKLLDGEIAVGTFSELGEDERREFDLRLEGQISSGSIRNPVVEDFFRWMFHEAPTSGEAVVSGNSLSLKFSSRYRVKCWRDADGIHSFMSVHGSITGETLAGRVCALRAGEF